MASISKQFATAKKADSSLKFADFQKTVKATPNTAQTSKVFLSEAQKRKIATGVSTATNEGIIDINVVDKGGALVAGQGIKNKTLASKQTTVPSKATQDHLADVRAVSKERGITEFEKKGQVAKPGEVFDPFAAMQARQMEGKKEAVSPFVAEGRAKAIRDKTMEKVGDQPVLVEPEGGYKSVEEKLEAEKNHQTQLADWWRRVGEESQKELGDVSSQFGTLQDQMNQYQGAIDALVQNLNQANPGTGTELSGILAEIQKTGGGNITPEILTKIQQLGESGISIQDFKTQVRALLTTGVQPGSLAATGTTDNGDSFTLGNGVTFPKGSNGLPMMDVGSIPDDANAYDVALMELATNNALAEGSLQNEIELLQNLSASVRRATETAKVEIENTFDTADNRLDEQKLKNMNSLKYNEMKLNIAKDNSLDNILEEEAKMEGYMRGTLESWGADRSTAGLSVMGNIKIKFLKQYTQTAQGYDLELSRLADLETEARLAYTNGSVEIANNKALGLEKINNGLLDNIDKIFTGTTQAFRNRDLKFLTNNTKYFKDVNAIDKADREETRDIYRDTRDFNFNLMKEYADQTGFVYEMDNEGNVTPSEDEFGYPIPTLDAIYKGMTSSTFTPTGLDSATGAPPATRATITNTIETMSPGWIELHGGDVQGSKWEYGIDVPIPYGSPIDSPVSGTILRVTTDQSGSTTGFGNNVLIKTDDGKLIQFSHLKDSGLSTVSGQNRIEIGEILGTSGNTGYVETKSGGSWHVPTPEERKRGLGAHTDLTEWNTIQEASQTKEEAIEGLPSDTTMSGLEQSLLVTQALGEYGAGLRRSVELRPTGDSNVDASLKQIQEGIFTVSDFPITGGSQAEREHNKRVKLAYNAQISAFPTSGKNALFKILDDSGLGNALAEGEKHTVEDILIQLNASAEARSLIARGVDVEVIVREYFNLFKK